MHSPDNLPSIETEVSTERRRRGAEVTPEDVRAELERILSSLLFQASEKRRDFLRFIVEETLCGRGESLKGYTIALSVFGRSESFDPQADPVVRLEARRLRRDLDSYYMEAGRTDPVRISIPKGSYLPVFEWHHGSPQAESIAPPLGLDDSATPASATGERSESWRQRPRMIAAGIATLAAAFALVVAIWTWSSKTTQSAGDASREPAVLVMPFDALSPGESTRHFAIGLSQELTSNLFRFTGFRLYNLPADFNKESSPAPSEFGRRLGVSYIVSGSVQTNDAEVRVTTTVSNASTGQIVWTRTSTRPADAKSLMAAQQDLASEIATVIGQPYGVVRNDIAGSASLQTVSSLESYTCVLRAYSYRRTFARSEYIPALRCLEQTVQRDPEYSDAWAMLGWLHTDAGRLGYSGDDNREAEYSKALEATTRAARLQPTNPLALKARGSTLFYMKRYEESEAVTRKAADLNPNDPEVLAQLGWRLAVRGHFDEGIPMLKRAIERSANPPGWYFYLIAIDLFLQGNYEESLKVAERSTFDQPGFGFLMVAVANGALGHADAAKRALEKMSEYDPVGRDPAGFLQRHGATDQITNALMDGLQKARALSSKS